MTLCDRSIAHISLWKRLGKTGITSSHAQRTVSILLRSINNAMRYLAFEVVMMECQCVRPDRPTQEVGMPKNVSEDVFAPVVPPGRSAPEPDADEPFRMLELDGSYTAAGRERDFDPGDLQSLFRDMYLGRRFDQQAQTLQRQGELGLWLMSLGQEAAQVGSMRGIRDTDVVFPSYREHVAAMCRGLGPEQLLSQWRGTTHAGWKTDDFRFHFYSLVLGVQTLHATGYAMGVQLDEADDVVLVYLGDGATSQGSVNEALNWASAVHAPVVFFCQNNGWAISTPTTAQFASPPYLRARGFGLESALVDGNDVLAVRDVTRRLSEVARNGGGPVFIEALTYRRAGHSTSDDPLRYRATAEDDYWIERDPISRMNSLLRASGTPESYFVELEAEGDALSERTRTVCRNLENPNLLDLFDQVYAEHNEHLAEQLSEAREFAAERREETNAPAHDAL
jgi:2-oxoisovalerate dehydrogenase E1 component alpha subunit